MTTVCRAGFWATFPLLGLLPLAPPSTNQVARGDVEHRIAWPNSDSRLNFSGGVRPPQLRYWNAKTAPILAPAVIWSAQSVPERHAKNEYRRVVRVLHERNPDIKIGRYYSALCVVSEFHFDPPETVPMERVAGAILKPALKPGSKTYYVDIRQPETRRRMARHFVETTQGQADFLALDNFTFEYWAPSQVDAEEWHQAQYALLEEVYRLAGEAKLPVVINAATRPEKTWDRISRSCDGLIFEMPIHPNLHEKGELLADELAAYRLVLDRGRFVGLIPTSRQFGLVAAAVMLIREPGDPIFISPLDWKPEPADWMEWPGQWGAPLGPYRRDGTRLERDFQKVTLEVDFATGHIAVQPKRPTQR
jgi:hypothetical protein